MIQYLIYLGCYDTEMIRNYGTETFLYRTFTFGIFLRYEIMIQYIFKGTEYEKSYRTVVTP